MTLTRSFCHETSSVQLTQRAADTPDIDLRDFLRADILFPCAPSRDADARAGDAVVYSTIARVMTLLVPSGFKPGHADCCR